MKPNGVVPLPETIKLVPKSNGRIALEFRELASDELHRITQLVLAGPVLMNY